MFSRLKVVHRGKEDPIVSEGNTEPSKLRSAQQMQRLMGAFMVSQPIMVAAKLGIADLVESSQNGRRIGACD